jgi:hypothetical protein
MGEKGKCYVHIYVNGKMIPFETIPGNGSWRWIEGWRRLVEGWIQLWYIVGTLVKATI